MGPVFFESCVVGVAVIQIFPLSYVTQNLKVSNICVGLSDCSSVARPLD